jgi:hypothetical protein
MKRFAILFSLIAAPALAHPGHVLASGGHDHWSLAAGVAVIIAAGFVALKRRS